MRTIKKILAALRLTSSKTQAEPDLAQGLKQAETRAAQNQKLRTKTREEHLRFGERIKHTQDVK
jgi:hypothetical protein